MSVTLTPLELGGLLAGCSAFAVLVGSVATWLKMHADRDDAINLAVTNAAQRDTLAALLHPLPPIDETVNAHLSGEHPIVSDPATAVAVVEVERVSIADRARNTVHVSARALGGMVLPLVALVALWWDMAARVWRDRRVIDVEPMPLPVPVPPQSERTDLEPEIELIPGPELVPLSELDQPIRPRHAAPDEASPIFAGLKHALDMPTSYLIIIPPKAEPVGAPAEPVAEVRDVVTVGA